MFRFLFGEPEVVETVQFEETLIIPAWNEAGECVFLEVPAPIRSGLHPKLTSRVARNLTFLRYDTWHGQT